MQTLIYLYHLFNIMETKIGVTTKTTTEFADYLQGDFKQIVRAGVNYNYLLAFKEHIDSRFEYQFDTIEAYEAWLVDFVYFVIPTDFIGYIDHYAGFVKEALIGERFDIICETKTIEVEGVLKTVPCSIVNVIPCSVTHWSDEGLDVLESVIGSWNNQNPNKLINIPYKFESYNELIAFRDEQI